MTTKPMTSDRKKHRRILGEGYYCVGVRPQFFMCDCIEGDWIGLADKYGRRIEFVDKAPRLKKKFKLIVEWK